ncbi:hypothetical protein OQA88_13253 [Cercophora sp. LCS_1]
MSRYLTPAKIGLLALIELYTREPVPNDAIIPVLNFMACHILNTDPAAPTDRWAQAENTISLVRSIDDFEKLLAPFAAADGLPLWDRLLGKLWGIDSLHSLQEFFGLLPMFLARTRDELRLLARQGEEPPTGVLLSRNAPFGAFVRRCFLEFARLPFDKATDLWKAFVKYRQPTAGYWRRRNPHLGPLSFDAVLVAGEHEWGDGTEELAVAAYGSMLRGEGDDATPVSTDENDATPVSTDEGDDATPVSTDDIEGLLEIQIGQLHKYGNRVPTEIRDQFQALLKESHTVPSLQHYLSYSDTWRSGDYPTSFDFLHRYFDYTMQNRDRPFYQYALMNLAILQSDFGSHKEAVATMRETVSTARENRDGTCLNFALNWLFHFGRAHPELVRELESNSMLGSGKETLAFLRVKARETGMWVLWSSALMGEAKLGLANGESISTALEHMVRSSQIIVQRNMKTMMGAQLAVFTALWDRLGLAYMAGNTCEVFLRCHASNAIFDDELKVTCRLAGLLAAKGKYDEAFAKLEDVDANCLRSAKPRQYWHLYRGFLKVRRDLHRNNLEAVDRLLSQLLQAGAESLEPDMVFVIDSLHVEALSRRGDFEAAFLKMDRLHTELLQQNRDIALRIRLLLSKAHLFDRVGRPEKGFSLCMRAASMAWRARLMSLLWRAIGALSNVLIALGEFGAAVRLLVAVLPRCLETDNVHVVATLYSLLADAYMGQAGVAKGTKRAEFPVKADGKTKSAKGNKRAEFLAKAHRALESAFEYFSAVEDVEKQCEVLAKESTLMRITGDVARARGYAARYLALKGGVRLGNN